MIAIWLPMLAGDARTEWRPDVLDDPRVISLWDEERLAGSWFAEHGTGGLGGTGAIVWDAYLAYGPDARWPERPSEPVAAGYPIIGATGALEERFIPLVQG